MLIKLLGEIMIFSGCSLWGFFKSYELARRKKSLLEMLTALEVLETEVVFSQNKLKKALFRISHLCGEGVIFSSAAENMEELGILTAWENAVDSNIKRLSLTKGDGEIIKILSLQLGMSDREGQKKNIAHVSALLRQAFKEADEEYQKSAKLYRSMGVLSGLFGIILLI